MKEYLILILFVVVVKLSFSQQRNIISGLVKDKLTGEPLIGANISSENTGTVSDAYGFYSMPYKSSSAFVIKASYVGYKPFEETIDSSGEIHYNILLEPGLEITEIQVTNEKPVEERLELGTIDIPVQQAIKMPMFGEPDILKTMQLLPGIQGGSDGRSNLYVRGGSPDQNLFMLDGTPLYYVNHLGGFVSVFHPDILKNIKLYKGNFPARFGGRLSSVIDLRMKEGNKKELHGSYGIGLISGDITLEGPVKTDKTSFIVSARRVWIDIFSRPVTKLSFQGASMGYNFYDFYGKVSHEQNSQNRFYFSIYAGDDKQGYYYKNKGDHVNSKATYVWGNILSTLRWNLIYSPRLNSDFTLFYTRYRYNSTMKYMIADLKQSDLYQTSVHDFGIKADYNLYFSAKHKLRFGGGASRNWFIPGQIRYKNVKDDRINDTIIGVQNQSLAINYYVYTENEINPTHWLGINIGCRLASFNVDEKIYSSFEPRLLANFNIGKFGALKAGYAKMMQPVHMLTYSSSAFPTDIWLPSTKDIAPGSASQYSAGYFKSFLKNKFDAGVELYQKRMTDLIAIKGGVPLINTNSWEKNVETKGTGNSKGLEFMLRKNSGKSTGWLSYTLSKSTRKFENLNNGKIYPFKYDRRHDISIVYNQKLKENVDFSATWVFGSGYPTTLHNGVYLSTSTKFWKQESPETSVFENKGEAYLYPGKNWLRMNNYHRLDIGLNFRKLKTGNKHKPYERTWTIGIYNAYNRQNAVFYYYDYKDQNTDNDIVLYQQSGFPFLPSIKYSVKF